ncbi:unnamed protein product [Ascophyllum nodosum]
MAPSFYGFGPAPPSGWSGVTASPGAGSYAAGVGRGSGGGVVATAEPISAGESQRRRWNGSPLGAAAWLKQRVRNGKDRILMQMMSTTQGTLVDAARFEKAPVPAEERQFVINGWRWHTKVVLRDIVRFRRVVLLAADAAAERGTSTKKSKGKDREVQEAVEKVAKSYKFVWSFSVAKLHNTEQALFFPWLRELLPSKVLPYLEEFDREREAIVRVGKKMGQLVEEARKASLAKTSPRAALLKCAHLSEDLEEKVARLSRSQESMIVPFTAAYVDGNEQWKFNEKVVLSLGLVDSQVFLVAMHDTLKPDKEEFKVFRLEVPKFARALIPTWRRLLYSPRAGCLE